MRYTCHFSIVSCYAELNFKMAFTQIQSSRFRKKWQRRLAAHFTFLLVSFDRKSAGSSGRQAKSQVPVAPELDESKTMEVDESGPSDSETKTQLKSMSYAQCRNPQMAIYWAGCLRGIPPERRLAARMRGRVICRNGKKNSWRLPEQIAQPRLGNYRHISLLVSLHGGDPFCVGLLSMIAHLTFKQDLQLRVFALEVRRRSC